MMLDCLHCPAQLWIVWHGLLAFGTKLVPLPISGLQNGAMQPQKVLLATF